MVVTRAALAVWVGLAAWGSGPRGLWDAVLAVDGREVAFRFELKGEGRSCRGAILDGERRIWSTSGVCEKGEVALRWSYFDSDLKATLRGGKLQGEYSRRTRAGVVKRGFAAAPFKSAVVDEGEKTADFGGAWRIQTDAERGARVMDGRFRQSGGEVTGTIQRVDGDFGTLSGRARGNKLRLSHFDGIRATLIEGAMTEKGTIEGTMDGKTRFTAARLEKAKAMGIPEPPDPSKWVTVKDPTAEFAFRFQDLAGRWVSLADDRFRGKAVIVTIMGSWCPNCHDEAVFLMELYRKYKGQGLEIVALGFEYTGELERDRETLGAFGKLHGVTYPMLLAGTTEDGEVLRKLPQLANFAGYPATIYLGRDHRVRAVHAGFAGPANAEEHAKRKSELGELVKSMLTGR
ncbi:MAG: TlpA family protein disulfide reductase [Acidobacteria bacterium]|nr:TlpA family protein disulfide reductase [Acidobacteriota bacterium]